MTPETIDVLWRLAADRMLDVRNSRALAKQQMGEAHPFVESQTKEIDKLATALIELRRLKFPETTIREGTTAAIPKNVIIMDDPHAPAPPPQMRYWCKDCEKDCHDPGAQRRRICPECGGVVIHLQREYQRRIGS